MSIANRKKRIIIFAFAIVALFATLLFIITHMFSFVLKSKKYNSFIFLKNQKIYIAYLKNDTIFSNDNQKNEKALSESTLTKLSSFDSGRYYMKKSYSAVGFLNIFKYVYPDDRNDNEILLDETDIIYAYDKIFGDRYYFIKEHTHIPDLRKDDVIKIRIEDVLDSFELTDSQLIEAAINSFSNIEKWEIGNEAIKKLGVDDNKEYKVYLYYKDFPLRQVVGYYNGADFSYDNAFVNYINELWAEKG